MHKYTHMYANTLPNCMNTRCYGFFQWEELFQIGQESDDDVLQERILQQAPNLCCTLIYKVTNC